MVSKNRFLRRVPEMIGYACGVAFGSGGIYYATQGAYKAAALCGIMTIGSLGAGYLSTKDRKTCEGIKRIESTVKNRLIETEKEPDEFQELFKIDYPAVDF